MRRIPNLTILICILASLPLHANPQDTSGTRNASPYKEWSNYSLDDKRYATFGFIDCEEKLKMGSSQKTLVASNNVYSEVDRLIARNTGERIGTLILRAMRVAPREHMDASAQVGSQDDGMLWRGLLQGEKAAYITGVFWCHDLTSVKSFYVGNTNVISTVNALDAWYVVSDDEWKDPRSDARVDIPIIDAIKRARVSLPKLSNRRR